MSAAGVCVAASLLAALLLGLSAPAQSQAETDPHFSLCRHSFYQEAPPQGLAGAGLIHRCHRLPGGLRFASLYNSTCGASVCSAFRLSQENNWGKQETERRPEDDGEGFQEESPPDSELLIPSLLDKGGDQNEGRSITANPFLAGWDELMSRLLSNVAVPWCSVVGATTEANLFVLTGTAGLSVGENGDCQVHMLWSAVCCASLKEKQKEEEERRADGEGGEESRGFSVGVVKGRGEEVKVVSVMELEEVTGVTGIFTGFCGEAESDGDVVALFQETLKALAQDMVMVDVESKVGASENTEGEQTATVSEEEETGSDDMPGVTEEKELSLSQSEAQSSTVPLNDGGKPQNALEMENETQSSVALFGGALMYLLSSSVSVLSAPLNPVFSTLISLPGQVTYVLGEDLAVLSTLPTVTLSLFQNIACDLWSGLSSTTSLVAGVGELFFSVIYSCCSPLVESLYSACHNGLTGTSQLALDFGSIVGGVLDNVWSVFKFLGGTVWDYTEGYTGTVLSELLHQMESVGFGLGKLIWRSGRGLGNMAGVLGGVVGGAVGSVVESVTVAFGGE